MSDELERDDAGDERLRAEGPDRGPIPKAPRRRPADDEGDVEPRRGGGSATKTIVIIISAVALIGFCAVGSCVGLFFYGMSRVRTTATTIKEFNDYKQIALAMHNYHAAYGHLPPLSMKTRNGKPGLSWRVAILPYLEHADLYNQFKIDEAWDHQTNRRLASQMPVFFTSLEDPTPEYTHVRLFVGKGAIYQPNRVLNLAEITDGASNTLLLVEAAKPVLWIQPEELTFDPSGPLPELGLPKRDFFLAAMADGETRKIRKSIAPEQIKAAITATGNEPVHLDD
jgi:hypothetical protein